MEIHKLLIFFQDILSKKEIVKKLKELIQLLKYEEKMRKENLNTYKDSETSSFATSFKNTNYI